MAVRRICGLFTWLGLRGALDDARLRGGGAIIIACGGGKTASELALMQHAKDITLDVQRRAWKSLSPGVRASEVEALIDREHRALGGSSNTFCIVSLERTRRCRMAARPIVHCRKAMWC